MKISNKDKGFTLIEIMIALVILALVSTIALISVQGAINAAVAAGCKADYRSVDAAISGFVSDNPAGGWPSSNVLYVDNAGNIATGSFAALGYITKLKKETDAKYSIDLRDPATPTVALSATRAAYDASQAPFSTNTVIHVLDKNGAVIGTSIDACSTL